MDERRNEQFWNSTLNEIKRGYMDKEDVYECLVCCEVFEKGRIYDLDGDLYEAKKAVELHVSRQHQSMLSYLLNMNTVFNGLSEVQRKILAAFSQGVTDKVIAEELGVAASTIRNHRYKLREREKQAKVFLAIMELLEENLQKNMNQFDKGVLCDAPKTANMIDDRFNITSEEKLNAIKNHFGSMGELKSYPSKEKKKVIVLEEIAKNFKPQTRYTEKEVNRILKRIFEDYATIRRALIEYGFMERADDGSSYWVKE
jgi:hypothetical protein